MWYGIPKIPYHESQSARQRVGLIFHNFSVVTDFFDRKAGSDG